MLPDESVEEFRTIYKKCYGEDISADDAREMARRLLMLYELLAKPLPEEDRPAALPEDQTSPLADESDRWSSQTPDRAA